MEQHSKKPISKVKRRFEVTEKAFEENLVDPLISEIERWKVWILVGLFGVCVLVLLWLV